MREKLLVLRNCLYKLFLIGFVFNVLFQLLVVAMGGDNLIEVAKILGLPKHFLNELLIVCIASVRIFFVYFILCPAFALHWAVAKDKVLNKKD